MNDMKFRGWWEQYSRNDFRRSDEIARDAWAAATKSHQLLIDAARKIVRVHGNGRPKQLDDAVLLLRVAMAEHDKEPNDRVEGRDAASSRRVPSHDGLCGNGSEVGAGDTAKG